MIQFICKSSVRAPAAALPQQRKAARPSPLKGHQMHLTMSMASQNPYYIERDEEAFELRGIQQLQKRGDGQIKAASGSLIKD